MSKILYKLVKNNNSKSAAYGKWYARAVSKETLTFREWIGVRPWYGDRYSDPDARLSEGADARLEEGEVR